MTKNTLFPSVGKKDGKSVFFASGSGAPPHLRQHARMAASPAADGVSPPQCPGKRTGPSRAGHHRLAARPASHTKEHAMNSVYGYARVSSTDQNAERQHLSLQRQGVPRRRIFTDRMSGKDFRRPRYEDLLARLRPGDPALRHEYRSSGPQLWGNTAAMAAAHAGTACGHPCTGHAAAGYPEGQDLLGTFIADLVLQVLSFVAQNERENIRRRQAEGIAAARLRGIRAGTGTKAPASQFFRNVRTVENGKNLRCQSRGTVRHGTVNIPLPYRIHKKV